MAEYNPGAAVTVGDLELNDTVFLRERRDQFGLPVPTHAVKVTELVPLPDGRVRVYVRNANSDDAVTPRLLGDLPATREFRAAVLAV